MSFELHFAVGILVCNFEVRDAARIAFDILCN